MQIVTQNIDDLHERAGSPEVLHLHGIITRSQSSADPALTYEIRKGDLHMGELCELGSQLRPHVVWFGEPVPMIEKAAALCADADIFLIIGTSLQVYPAAGLKSFVRSDARKIMVDPDSSGKTAGFEHIRESAGKAVPRLVEELMKG